MPAERACAVCDAAFTPKLNRPDIRFCSGACKAAAYRKRKAMRGVS